MVRTSQLQYRYSNGTEFHFPDISLEGNQHLLIHGPSGSGKSTWMHLLGGLLVPSGGEIHISGQALHTLSNKELDACRRNSIGIVFQKPHFVSALSVYENLELIQSYSNTVSDIESITDSLAINHRLHARPQDLSGGELQRMSIAMVLLKKPALIIADEPTASLDDVNCDTVASLLIETAASLDANLIVVSHDHRIKPHFINQIGLS